MSEMVDLFQAEVQVAVDLSYLKERVEQIFGEEASEFELLDYVGDYFLIRMFGETEVIVRWYPGQFDAAIKEFFKVPTLDILERSLRRARATEEETEFVLSWAAKYEEAYTDALEVALKQRIDEREQEEAEVPAYEVSREHYRYYEPKRPSALKRLVEDVQYTITDWNLRTQTITPCARPMTIRERISDFFAQMFDEDYPYTHPRSRCY